MGILLKAAKSLHDDSKTILNKLGGGRILETMKARRQQNRLPMQEPRRADSMTVFIEVEPYRMCGGQMSLFTLYKYTRELLQDHMPVLMCTMPGFYTYYHNDRFKNQVDIYRWSQIIRLLKNKEHVTLHIPEVCIVNPETKKEQFLARLSPGDKKILQNIEDLRINILNQNIDSMPNLEYLEKFREITPNVTQTVAHMRYCSQEVADRFNLPTTHFSGYIELPKFKKCPFEKKKNYILFSADLPPHGLEYKIKFVQMLQAAFPNYTVDRIFNVTFEEYAQIVADAKYVISFGEGFDGYFNNAALLGTVGFAVYNTSYFPDRKWKVMPNVYNSFDNMFKYIVNDIKKLDEDEDKYNHIVKVHKDELDLLYSPEKTKANICRFYNEQYDFYPIEPGEDEDIQENSEPAQAAEEKD